MEEFLPKYVVTPRYLSTPSKRRSGRPLSPGVRFLVAHDTGNPGSTATGNVNYYEKSRNEQSASAHLFVDHREIIECIPALTAPPEKAWHVLYNLPTDNQLFGHNANDAAIGVEYCYGGSIDDDEAYRKYIWVLACLCHRFDLDPARAVVGHFILDPRRKTDPVTGLARSCRSYEQLLRDVVTEFAECTGNTPPAAPLTTMNGEVRTTVRLNLRQGQPSIRAPIVQTVTVGTVLRYTGWSDAGDPINGNPRWYRDGQGNWFWSGGVTIGI